MRQGQPMPSIEDRVLEQMMNENIGFNEFSQMDKRQRDSISWSTAPLDIYTFDIQIIPIHYGIKY